MSATQHLVELSATNGAGDNAPTDAISSVSFSPSGNALAVSSWDRTVRVYVLKEQHAETKPGSVADLIDRTVVIKLRAPVLDVCFGADDTQLFAVGLDHCVLDLSQHLSSAEQPGGSPTVLSQHSEPTNKVAYSPTEKILISTSWDNTLHVHDPSTKHYIRVRLPSKPFALALSSTRGVVAMSDRKVSVYDLHALRMLLDQAGSTSSAQDLLDVEPWQQRESSLKFMTRAVACMPDGHGFATSSIEGRVGVDWFDPEAQKDMYAFKCHRQTQSMVVAEGQGDGEGAADGGAGKQEEQVDIVYPVNALAFHPVHHASFATAGGDGVVALWDANTKRRLKQYPKLGASVAAMDFHPNGRLLAIGVSPGFEGGKEDEELDQSLTKVVFRIFDENEAKGKPAKSKSSKAK